MFIMLFMESDITIRWKYIFSERNQLSLGATVLKNTYYRVRSGRDSWAEKRKKQTLLAVFNNASRNDHSS